MSKKQRGYLGILAAFAVILAAAFLSDRLSSGKDFSTEIERNDIGEGDTEMTFLLDAGDELKQYEYSVTIPERNPSEEEALGLLADAEEEIDAGIYEGQDANRITGDLSLKDSYVDGKVTAEWSFLPYGYFDEDGKRTDGRVPEEGVVISAEAELKCGAYTELYDFSFKLFPEAKTKDQKLLADIDDFIESQAQTTGETITLPESMEGLTLSWASIKPNMALKVAIFEVIIAILLFFLRKEKAKEKQKDYRKKMQADYPELVSQLAILLGCGMSLKQAWNKISAQYLDKRKKENAAERPGFEAMVTTNYEMTDGESERIAIGRFGEEAGTPEYFRLSRILIRSMNKGSRGIGELLNRESAEAFEIRKNTAKKLGEEAGTKMLLPLILMLCIVMVIVIAPAIMSFHN